jgi:hypothetical protein
MMNSYLVLKCNESLANQLLFAPDAIAYKLQHSGHFIPVSLLGTLILMISVIALANAKIQLQIAWAASYVILNIGHWMAAALPRGMLSSPTESFRNSVVRNASFDIH